MEIEETRQGDITIVRLQGDLELTTRPEVEEKLREICNNVDVPKIIVDLKETRYVDSSGLGVLVGLYSHVRKSEGQLAITNPNRNVKRLFDLTNVERFLPVTASLDDAVESMSA